MSADREKGGKKTTIKARVKVLAPLITLSALALVLVVAATIPLGLASNPGANQLSAHAYGYAWTHTSPASEEEDDHVISCPGPASAKATARSTGTCGQCHATGAARSHAAGGAGGPVTMSGDARADAWVRRGHNGEARATAWHEEDPVVEAVGAGSYTIEIQLNYGITLKAQGQGAVKASVKITVKQGGQTKHYGEAVLEAGVLTVNPSPPGGASLLWTSGDWSKTANSAVFAARTISKTVSDNPAAYVRTELSAEVPGQVGSSVNGYAVATTEKTVGGIWVPVDKLALLAPWIFIGVSVAAITVGTIYSRKRWLGKAAAPKP